MELVYKWINTPAAATARAVDMPPAATARADLATAQADPGTAESEAATGEAEAGTAQSHARTGTGKDTALADKLEGTAVLRNAQNVPTTPVQSAWFEGFHIFLPDDSAQADGRTIRLTSLGDIQCRAWLDLKCEDFADRQLRLALSQCGTGNGQHTGSYQSGRRQ